MLVFDQRRLDTWPMIMHINECWDQLWTFQVALDGRPTGATEFKENNDGNRSLWGIKEPNKDSSVTETDGGVNIEARGRRLWQKCRVKRKNEDVGSPRHGMNRYLGIVTMCEISL